MTPMTPMMTLIKNPFAGRLFLVATTAITFSGCEATGDPRAGGIFWSETKARQRIAAKQSEKRQAEHEAASEQAKLARLQDEIRSLHQRIASAPRASNALQSDLARVERRSTELSTNDSLEVSEKERQLAELRAEVNRLEERNQLLLESR
jgi:septal ring factor EnvC (AmiA/AmiB activator)